MKDETPWGRQGRAIALLIAGVCAVYLILLAVGDKLGWSQRTLALFDLAALAGFGMALWLIYGLWRSSRNDRDPDVKD
ncbi:DUF5337 family protein [Pararhodobacter oceanensis]|uniref:DUF5337 family protein n=1 Tax=Pararhodobacter oceanensis TaxID=2172121 RepID=UPI003A93A347